MSFEINSTNPVVRAIIEGTAPQPAKMAAARGILPLPQNDLLEVLVALATSSDAELARQAQETLGTQDPGALLSAFQSAETAPSVLGFFAGRGDFPKEVCAAVLTNPRTPPASLVGFAERTTDGELLELLSLNQQLLISMPAIIDAIIANPARTTEAERRAQETKREFFEKERGAQQIASELRAQGKTAAAEFIEQAEFAATLGEDGLSLEDAVALAEMIEVPDADTDDTWLALEYIEELYEETPEERAQMVNQILGELRMDDDPISAERVSMINRVMRMNMRDRIRLAMKGDREARTILIRDPNRIVSQAVVQNPKITEQEIEKIASMRTVPEDVLRQIANSRLWSRNYSVMHNLARNPRTPMANVISILTRLQMRDLIAISKNRNVPDAVRRQAVRLVATRKGR